MNNILVDTNILIYGIDESSEFHKRSKEILTGDKFNLFITSKNVSEYFAVCTKLKIDKEIVLGFYNDIKKNTIILYPNDNSIKKFEMLVKKYFPTGNRVYDLEIVSVMLANDVKYLATFNTKDFDNIKEISLINKQ